MLHLNAPPPSHSASGALLEPALPASGTASGTAHDEANTPSPPPEGEPPTVLRASWLSFVRRQQSCRDRLEALGFDDQGRPLRLSVVYHALDVPVKECCLRSSFFKDPVVFNPVVTLLSVVGLWSIVVWCATAPQALTTLEAMRSTVSLTCTWIFQGTKTLFFFFLLYITYRYGHIHLGPPDSTPEFSTLTYFSMIFASGVSVGLLIFHVSEPLSMQTEHFYANAGYRTQDEVDMFAINMAVTNWGITGWISLLVVGVAVSLAGHVFRLPMTFRSAFYPILGAYTWGWMGDFIDALASIVTLTAICTTLGLCAVHIVTGLVFLKWVDANSTQQHIASIEIATIWVMTCIATASAVSGLHGGIRILSIVALVLSTLCLVLVMMLDQTSFLLNLQVQEFGYYIQNSFFMLHCWTDAFGQLREGSGRAIDGKASDPLWMDYWMIYTQASVNSWAAFVGVFIALVSRGRKLWEVVVYGFVVPVVYCLVWFTAWGGIALRQSRQAMELQNLGERFFNNSRHFLVNQSEFCYQVPQSHVVVDDQVVFANALLGVTPVCQFDSENWNTAAFKVLHSFSYPESFPGGQGLGPSLSILMILAAAVYYVSSSDSACLVVDSWASNGRRSHHWLRRMFWTLTVGALATALMSSRGEDAMTAAKAASIICGLPITIFMCYLLQSILLFCRAAEELAEPAEYKFPDLPDFTMPVYGGIFNVIEYATSLGVVNPIRVDCGIHRPSVPQCVEFGKGLLVPVVSLYQILSTIHPLTPVTNVAVVALYTICYYSWIVMWIILMGQRRSGLRGLILMLFGICGVTLGSLRTKFRRHHNNLRSNMVADYVASFLLWPQVLAQMRLQQQSEQQIPPSSLNRKGTTKRTFRGNMTPYDDGSIQNIQ